MSSDSLPPASAPPAPPRSRDWLRDEIAYILPMLVFLLITQIGVWWKSTYPIGYVIKANLVAILLIYFRRHYTRISWKYWWLGIIVGVIGIVQWVGMQLWLQAHLDRFKPDPHPFNPFEAFSSPRMMWTWIVVRVASAVLIVPVMEELFWRDYLWRQIQSPNDFKIPPVGEFELAPFLIVPAVFAFVHGNWWPTAIVWALMIAALLVYTKSLGACIIAHAVTNLLLAAYVLKTHDWAFW